MKADAKEPGCLNLAARLLYPTLSACFVMASQDRVLEQRFLLEHFNLSRDIIFTLLGLIITGSRLLVLAITEEAVTYDHAVQAVRFVLASSFVACYMVCGFSRYVYIRGPMGALTRVLCACGLGYRHPSFCKARLCFWQWPFRLLTAHLFPLLTNTSANWYWIGGLVSWLSANLMDVLLGSMPCWTYTCVLQLLALMLQSPLQLLSVSLFSKNSVLYAVQIIAPGVFLTYREQQARELFHARHAPQKAAEAAKEGCAEDLAPEGKPASPPAPKAKASGMDQKDDRPLDAPPCSSMIGDSADLLLDSLGARSSSCGTIATQSVPSPNLQVQQQQRRQQPGATGAPMSAPMPSLAAAAAVAAAETPAPAAGPAAAPALPGSLQAPVAGAAGQPREPAAGTAAIAAPESRLQAPAAAAKSRSSFLYKSVSRSAIVGVKIQAPPGADHNLGKLTLLHIPAGVVCSRIGILPYLFT